MNIKIVETEDQSHTIYSGNFGEHYHSIYGSINESMHIFIESGFKQLKKKKINVLEIGFGTGLNAFLTLIESKKNNITVNYTSIEKYPLEKEIYAKLNYPEVTECKISEFISLHEAEWNKKVMITPCFHLSKIPEDLKNVIYKSYFDVVYFDAFSPDSQPELWTYDIFKSIYNSMNINGILTTYSAKGEVKRTLKRIGFQVEHIPGPKGKRVITRAIKNC